MPELDFFPSGKTAVENVQEDKGLTMFSSEDDLDILRAVRLIQSGTGWGRVELVIKDGKLEDINTTINKRQSLKRRP